MSCSELELSSSELRSKLYNSFKSKGFLGSVKTQLRNRLALELQENISSKLSKSESAKDSKCSPLFEQFANSLVANHMRCSSYEYTLSVFITESLTNPDKIASIDDILSFLRINPESKLYQKIKSIDEKKDKGFLCRLLEVLCTTYNQPSSDSSVQTNDLQHSSQLDQKLLDVEREHFKKSRNDRKNEAETLEARVLSYQRKYDAQKKAEMEAEIERFRTSELSAMRIEERAKCDKEFDKLKHDLHETHRQRLKELDNQIEEAKVKAERQQQLMEKESYEQRQGILKELQSLREREMEIQTTHQNMQRNIETQESQLQMKLEQFRYKEDTLKHQEERFENRVKDEIMRMKYDMMENDQLKIEERRKEEQQLREEKLAFDSQRNMLMGWKEEAEKLKALNHQLNIQLARSKQTISTLNEKLLLCRKQPSTVEFDQVKHDNTLLTKEIEELQRHLEELRLDKAERERDHKKLVKDLLSKISTTSSCKLPDGDKPEADILYQEKEKIHQEKIRNLKNKYDAIRAKCEELHRMNEELLLSQQGQLREVEELRNALFTLKQENAKLARYAKNSRQTIANRLSQTKTTEQKPKKPLLVESALTSVDQQPEINTSKDVLLKLEQEAMALEKSYKQFRERQMSIETSNPQKVHFSSIIQHHSPLSQSSMTGWSRPSQQDTLDLSKIIEGNTLSFQRLPGSRHHPPPLHETQQLSHPLSSTRAAGGVDPPSLHGTQQLSHPLSSTRAAGGVDAPSLHETQQLSHPLSSTRAAGGVDAPSLHGISRVQTTAPRNMIKTDEPSTINQQHIAPYFTGYSQQPTPMETPGLTTCYSLTQHPLQDASLTQYPLTEPRTLSQHPLVDSDLTTPKDAITPLVTMASQNKLGTLSEHSINQELEKSANASVSTTRKDELQETSIVTFDSPEKHAKDDTFGTPQPAFGTPRRDEDRSSSSQKSNNGELHTSELHSHRSATKLKMDQQEDHSERDHSEKGRNEENRSEIRAKGKSEDKSEGEVKDGNAMNAYMQLIMSNEKQHSDRDQHREESIKELTLSNSEKSLSSQRSVVSEFEW